MTSCLVVALGKLSTGLRAIGMGRERLVAVFSFHHVPGRV